ncbi:PTS sugar transporter subunit IIA [Enterococcus massiliensis]|uniref:PTS sugar transporter subunit IIA n=1 Tax=Enterococcus massiliensis TaxID=1640685 RepID=UPI00065DF6A8|nr:PTS glucose transporter subunit IIA [Enterococcus massiliensis]
MFGFNKKKSALFAPVTGDLIKIDKVKDPVFSQKMMGDGFGVEPSEGAVFAPVSGKVTAIFPTKHAITILMKDGTEALVHMGIDTVELKGQGFEILVPEGQAVSEADQLATIDLDFLAEQGKRSTILVVFPDAKDKKIQVTEGKVTHSSEVGRFE